MESYVVFRDLAIILIAGKYLGLLARKLNAPQVAGEILAGLLVGPCILNLVQPSDFLAQMAELGVVLLMFGAGLDSDIDEIIKSGPVALLVAMCGVFVPFLAGTGLYAAFYGIGGIGSESFLRAVFIGSIMTATSVTITVQSLRELGHLKGKVGTTVLSAAIIDDVLGIIVLTVVVGFKDPSTSIGGIVMNTVLFFLFALALGFLVFQFFERMDLNHPHTRRLPILGLAFCLIMAYIAEAVFGVADITGAYMAGLVLSKLRDSSYIERRLDISSYTIFSPVFFASVGLNTDISNFNASILLFSLAFVAVALGAKIVGCGGVSLLCRFTPGDALKVGVGMMNRGEVALIIAQKGLAVGLMESAVFPAVIVLILASSILTPVILQVLYKLQPEEHPDGIPAK